MADPTAPDTERAERLAATKRLLAAIKRHGAETQAEDYLADEVTSLLVESERLTGLLAEREATIGRVRELTFWDDVDLHPSKTVKVGAIRAALDPQEAP